MPGALPAIPSKSLILVEPPLITRAAWDEHLGHLAAVAPAHGLSEWDHDVLRRTACRRDKR